MSEHYDSGYLNDFGGGNVLWWHDYIRYEVGKCNDFWVDDVDALTARVTALESALRELVDSLEGIPVIESPAYARALEKWDNARKVLEEEE